MSESKPSILSPATLMPAAAALALTGVAVTSALWLEGRFNGAEAKQDAKFLQLQNGVDKMVYRIERVEEILTQGVRWNEFETSFRLLQAENPTLKVTIPRK